MSTDGFFGRIDISRGCIDISRQLVSLLEDDTSLCTQKEKQCSLWCILRVVLFVYRDNCHWNEALKNKCASAKQNIKIAVLRFDGSLELHCMAKTQMHYSFSVFFSSVACLKLWRSKTYLCILTDNGTTFHSLTVI